MAPCIPAPLPDSKSVVAAILLAHREELSPRNITTVANLFFNSFPLRPGDPQQMSVAMATHFPWATNYVVFVIKGDDKHATILLSSRFSPLVWRVFYRSLRGADTSPEALPAGIQICSHRLPFGLQSPHHIYYVSRSLKARFVVVRFVALADPSLHACTYVRAFFVGSQEHVERLSLKSCVILGNNNLAR